MMVTVDYAAIELRLRELRIENDLTQKELAGRVGVTQGCVSNVENGNMKPSLAYILSECALFGVALDSVIISSEAAALERRGGYKEGGTLERRGGFREGGTL